VKRFASFVSLCMLALGVSSSCVLADDPCEGVECDPDRICAVIDDEVRCLCADPAVEQNGVCVVPDEE
jgi:hypothetical protein